MKTAILAILAAFVLFLLPAAAEAAKHPTCDLGPRITDTVHADHTCPANMKASDCWWLWHCCQDGQGNPLRPFLNEEVECSRRECRSPNCGPAATPTNPSSATCSATGQSFTAWTCNPNDGAHITDAALAEYCERFYPDQPWCS